MKFTISVTQGGRTDHYHVQQVHSGPSLERFLVTPFRFHKSILISANRPYLMANGLRQHIKWRQENGSVNPQYLQLITIKIEEYLKKHMPLKPHIIPTLFEQH